MRRSYGKQPVQIQLIRRAKLSGVGSHYGVVVWYRDQTHDVYDLGPEFGIERKDLDGFAHGRSVDAVETVDDAHGVAASWQRLHAELRSAHRDDFRFFNRNCEHVARFIVTGKHESPQIQGLVGAGVVLGVLFILNDEAA